MEGKVYFHWQFSFFSNCPAHTTIFLFSLESWGEAQSASHYKLEKATYILLWTSWKSAPGKWPHTVANQPYSQGIESGPSDANKEDGREFILEVVAMTATSSLWGRRWWRNKQQCLVPMLSWAPAAVSNICWKRQLFFMDSLGRMVLAVVLAANLLLSSSIFCVWLSSLPRDLVNSSVYSQQIVLLLKSSRVGLCSLQLRTLTWRSAEKKDEAGGVGI